MKVSFDACMKDKINGMSNDNMKACIDKFLFRPNKSKQKDSELLSIVILKDKSHHLDFLKAYTKWNTVGKWMELPNEKNVQIDIQFLDTEKEEVGNRLMKLFKGYNKRVIKEDVLYCRTMPIEETTL
jgi:tRNA uridine 5-carbamoylmethylation protein Kti12